MSGGGVVAVTDAFGVAGLLTVGFVVAVVEGVDVGAGCVSATSVVGKRTFCSDGP
jgi:hypothetical protein